ncbi:MAG: hypothetical protein AAF916_06735 [Planctomycetota bacterium]
MTKLLNRNEPWLSLAQLVFSLVTLNLVMGQSASAGILVDFNDLPGGGSVIDPIDVNGTQLVFENLVSVEVGSNGFGFNGTLPTGAFVRNQVIEADRSNLNGVFLTAPFSNTTFRPDGFVRSIRFSQPVFDLSVFVADIDAGQGMTAKAFDDNGLQLSSEPFPASLNLGLRTQEINFGNAFSVSEITFVGDDPIGIDNLFFRVVPEPGAAAMLGSMLCFMLRRKRDKSFDAVGQ